MSTTADWREVVLASGTPLPSSPTVQCTVSSFGAYPAVIAAWDFSVQGGSFGEADADAFVGAVAAAIDRGLPLVSVLRSGGTKLPEGMRALVGIPRSALALTRLRAAHLPHVTVANHPTTGGVWVGIGSTADLRIAVQEALVGFSGPRPIEAMTGRAMAAGANTAEAALAAGLVDAVVPASEIVSAVEAVLAATTPGEPEIPDVPALAAPAAADAWGQVEGSRQSDRPTGADLIDSWLSERFALAGADTTVAAAVGRLAGRSVVAAALAASRATMPTPAGYALLTRAAQLAGTLDRPLIVVVDTPGADPHTEADGLAAAIANAMTAVLECPSPTISFVHGEGGSGGALAGAVTDVVGIGESGWFAAMGPEGAAATLRIEPGEAARRMRITPADLLENGFGDVFVPDGLAPTWLATTIDRLAAEPAAARLARRVDRWSSRLPGQS
ncbi:MAG: acetyl-CoA carboxylase subunit alpha/beta [Frankiaceae bacterium]|nr:acetyl-CoA carboxylase subunit alpha/beta [Frankiaceae bacterium]MBV9873028.1 acetyl-CoA carboxylase subunit alpha/beta [Frankiaceae bacterium]